MEERASSRLSAEQQRKERLFRLAAEAPMVQFTADIAGGDTAAALQARLAGIEIFRSEIADERLRERADTSIMIERHDMTALASDALALAIHALAREQRERVAAAWTCMPIAAAVVETAGAARVLLTAPAWSADAHSLASLAGALRDSAPEPTTALHYTDLIHWLDELAQAPDVADERELWSQALERSASWRGAIGGGLRQSRLEGVLAASISRDPAHLLACWLVLLSRRSAIATPALGYRASNRALAQLAAVIGPIARDLPFDVCLRAEDTLGQTVARVALALDELAESSLYFTDPAQDAAALRGYRYGFAVTPAGGELLDASEVYELAIAVNVGGQIARFSISYDPDVLGADEVAWIARQYSRLLEAESSTRLMDLELVDAEQQALLSAQCCESLAVCADRSFGERFGRIAAQTPDQIALRAGTLCLSYAELDRWANRFANFLAAEGCRAGQRVALCLGRSPEQIVSMLGCLKAGCAYVPIDPQAPRARIADIMSRAGIAVMVTTTEHMDKVSDSHVELPLIDWVRDRGHVDSASSAPPALVVASESEAYVIFTSGSTGVPKGVAVPHRALLNYVDAVMPRLALAQDASLAALSTVAADLAYTAVFGALGSGRCLRLMPEAASLDAEALAAEFASDPVDCLKIVPSHLAALLVASDPARLLPRDCLVLGGEALTWDLVERLRTLAPELRIVNHYGPTETTVGIACHVLDAEVLMPRGAGVPIGRALPGNATYVLDVGLRPVAIGIEGDLYLSGANLSSGYVADGAATARSFLPDPFTADIGKRMYRSGDRVVLDAQGRLIFRGRADRQLKLRGFRIELGEIEAAIRSSGLVDQVAVELAEGDGRMRLVAYMVCVQPGREAAVREHVAAQLPDYMQPVAWEWLERLPLNANGKIDRAALPRPRSEQPQMPRREPSLVEVRLLRLCEELLSLRDLSLDDNFFALGGDSIVAIQLVARARQNGYHFTPKQVFESESIGTLAGLVKSSGVASFDQGAVTGESGLSPIQARFFARVREARHHYNQACLYDLPATADFPMLQRVSTALLNHHDALRARFHQDQAGAWRQSFVAPGPEQAERCAVHVTSAAADEALANDVLQAAILEAQRDFDLSEAPLVRMVQIEFPALNRRHLLVVAHHLVIDAFSWRVLEEDIETLYGRAIDGIPITLPEKTCSYKAWVQRIERLNAEGGWQAERSYWQRVGEDCADAELPDAPADRIEQLRNRSVVLDAATSAALSSDIHQVFKTNTQDFLVAALALAFKDLDGRAGLGLMLESHGRDLDGDAPDVSRTVGWFTSMHPLAICVPDGIDPVTLVKQVKEQLRAVPGQGLGYGVLNYLTPGVIGVEEPTVCFNYLGKFSDAVEQDRLVPVSAHLNLAQHSTRSEQQSRLFKVEILALQNGAELLLNFVFDASCLTEGDAETLCLAFERHLTALISACRESPGGLTPSDVPGLDMGQRELDELLSELDASFD